MKKLLYYLPRISSILIVLFFAAFIVEGFDPEFGWQSGLMHGLLMLVVLAIVIFTWKWPKIGGWIFILSGAWYLFTVLSQGWWGGIFIGSVPLAVGILFLVGAYIKR
ncbi:MAG: hypothetical protein WC244_03860 [Patescibacteria group bacterium]|jgi:hypothetical protein